MFGSVTLLMLLLDRFLHCIQAVEKWMGSNRLQMNPDKTHVIWLSLR